MPETLTFVSVQHDNNDDYADDDGDDDDDAFLDGIVDVGDGLVIRLQSHDHIGLAQSTREYSIFDLTLAWWSCLFTKAKTKTR